MTDADKLKRAEEIAKEIHATTEISNESLSTIMEAIKSVSEAYIIQAKKLERYREAMVSAVDLIKRQRGGWDPSYSKWLTTYADLIFYDEADEAT